MFGIHLGKTGEKIVAVADVGGGSAGVAILAVPKNGPALVLAANRSILPIEERTQAATIAGIAEQLSRAAESVQKAYALKAGRGTPSELYCILRAPWSRSKTARVEWTFDKETLIAQKTIDGLAHKALDEDTELDKKNVFEASIVRVELNEYPTSKPIGKRAKRVSVFTVLSDCNSEMKNATAAALQKSFPHIQPTFRSSTRALIAVLAERAEASGDYLIVDMSSEGTGVVAVRDGVASEHVLIKEGVRTILKRLSGSGMPEETLSLVRMLAHDQCSTAACETVAAAMAHTEPELVRVFGEGLASLASVRRLPNKLVLATHPDMSPWLAKFFSRIDFTQFTLTAQPFVVEALTPHELTTWVQADTAVALDTGLALGAALVHIEKAE